MTNFFRLFALALVTLALLSGHFPGSESRCSCGSGTAFAQTPATASDAIFPGNEIARPATTESASTTEGKVVVDAASATPAIKGPLPVGTPSGSVSGGPLPKLVDVGAGKCIPCKKMAPILEEAKKLYTGLAEVVFIDVWENRSAGEPYGVRMIPTQIFYDAAGKEVFRHEGFFPMEDIQKQFESMGVILKKQ